jgi:hypothetical protein
MYERFIELFPADLSEDSTIMLTSSAIGDVSEFLRAFGGMSFGNRLYRIIKFDQEKTWIDRVLVAYPEFQSKVRCFGFDWMGNVFAVDASRLVDGLPGVVMFEPGAGKALNIPSNLGNFHDSGLPEFGEAALAISGYSSWLKSGGSSPNYNQCIGSKKPRFLGGSDTIDNMELSDIDVYWHITGQLVRKTRGLPPGTPVRTSIS